MKLLKNATVNLLTGLNVFILFFLLYGHRMEIPGVLQVAGRMHPMLLHFPIVFLLTAFVFEAFRNRFSDDRTGMERTVEILLLSGALSAAATVVMGLFLSREEGYSGSTLQWHKWMGVAVSFLSATLWWGYSLKRSRKMLQAAMVVTGGTLLAAGHFGAALTHGENYVLEPVGSPETNTINLTEARVYPDLVQPILKEKCFSCHNPDKAKGQLVMTDTASMLAGGESGKALVAGKSGESLLVERLLLDIDHKHRMPPKGKPQLSETEIALIRAWIDGGADFTATLADIPSTGIKKLASELYGDKETEDYDFGPPDKSLVQQLNTNYRLVVPVAFSAPALDVSFFQRDAFDSPALEELKAVATQVVHLNLSSMPVGDKEADLVSSFPNLRRLNLNYTGFTDKGLESLKHLSGLRSLMVAGTRVSAQGLDALLKSLKLAHIYAWNTSLSKEEADSLMRMHAGLRIDTGSEDDDHTMLQLNAPGLDPGNMFFRQPFSLIIRHPVGGTDLLYTLDGSEPDSAQSSRFREAITVTQNTVVKVKAIKKGWIGSPVQEKSYTRTTYLPDTFSLEHAPHPLHKARGAASLFDLKEGSPDILYASDGNWLGYQGQEFAAELGFANPVALKEIVLSTLLSAKLEAFPPYEVEIRGYGPDGTPEPLIKLNPKMPSKDSEVQRNMISCPLNGNKSFTRLTIRVRPVAKLPAWHPNAGSPAWFFIDEILLN